MKTTELPDHVIAALVRETTTPGAFVPIWKIADRIKAYEPTITWVWLLPIIDQLEEAGVLSIGPGRAGQSTVRFEGLIIFDAQTGDRIIIPTGFDAYMTQLSGDGPLFGVVRIPLIPS